MTTLPLRKLVSRAPLQRGFVLIALAFFCFGFADASRAVTPPPDGDYGNGNTAEGGNVAAGTDALHSLTSGRNNTAIGAGALFSNTSGGGNTAIGVFSLSANTTGGGNTATGPVALSNNTTGADNTANGFEALWQNTTGNNNVAIGNSALDLNRSGSFNTAIGVQALYSNAQQQGATTSRNTAIGYRALFLNQLGESNTATGVSALQNNLYGSQNTASGFQALLKNTDGIRNTANGVNALSNSSTGSNNTADGFSALQHNTAGNKNTANGINALIANTTGNSNTASGDGALGRNTTGSFNTAVGSNAGANLTTGSNNIDIGAPGVAGESNTMRLGGVKQTSTYIAGVFNQTLASGVAVMIDSTGHLGTVQSSERFKTNIQPMEKTSEAVLQLKPVTFRYRHELDPAGIPQFGLIAEEVEKVDPDLVVRDSDGKVTTVRYEAVNAMLLNEFLKQHRRAQLEEEKIAALEAIVAKQQKQIETLTAGLLKVSAGSRSEQVGIASTR